MIRLHLFSKVALAASLMSFVLGTSVEPLHAKGPEPDTLGAWNRYVRLTEARIDRETRSATGKVFAVPDLGEGTRARGTVLSGDVAVERIETRDTDGNEISVPGGTIQHWRGAILIPGVTLDEVLADVQHPDAAEGQQEDVLETRVLDRGPGWLRLYLKLVRSKIVTAAYNTEHIVRYRRYGPDRADSRTIALKIAELSDLGTPEEREKPPSEDRGFLWRLNSYWRYERVEEGVLVELESVTLSRSIPVLVRPFVTSIVNGVARESLERTLVLMRERMRPAEPRGD